MYRYERTGELLAQAEDGRRYRLIEYTKFLNLADAHTATRWEAVGPNEYRTDAGQRGLLDFLPTGGRRNRVSAARSRLCGPHA